MHSKGEWHEFRASYERIQSRGGGRFCERGELTIKAKNERDAHEKAVHLLHAAGVRYQFKLTIKRVEQEQGRRVKE
jgi:hypothetical protein